MLPKPLTKTVRLVIGLCALTLLGAGSAWADCPGDTKPSAEDPIQMLVLGDSIMWGQGLKTEHKFSWRVKCWLQEKTGREVQTRIEAHSGAHLEGIFTNLPFESDDGEINLPFPTINEQLDAAAQFYGPSRPDVDLILIDGCINDVDVSNLLNVSTTPEWLRETIAKSCGAGMHKLLRRVTENFPNAQVMVTSYYRVISSETEDNAFIRLLVKKLNSESRDAQHMTYQEMRARLIMLSELWYKISTASLGEAVAAINKELGEKSLPARVAFIEIDFWPEHSFSASNTLLWNFMFGSTNLSGFRKVILALTLGTAAYKPDDEVRDTRIRRCKEVFKAPKDRKESKNEREDRKNHLLICRYASLGHPNQMGALVYTEAIKGKLQGIIDRAGWKRAIAAH
jgi:hypothetical protein